jgi:hypothetical protein
MGEDQLKYVSGEFEGYFYTHQKMPMGELEKLPGGNTHQVYIYRGELKNYSLLDNYKPEEHLNREGLLLHNVTNIQLSNSSGSEKRIYDFDQLVLKNVQVPQSWELDGKTYGIIQGSLVGKIKKQANPSIGNSPENIPPPPTIPPKEPEKKWWKTVPPIVGGTNPTPPIGGSNRRGCLSWFWDVLKWLLLILLLILLWKCCKSCNENSSGSDPISVDSACLVTKDSLLHVIDSLSNQIKEVEERSDSLSDELIERVDSAGGKVGAITVSLMWNTTDDADLALELPSGKKIWYGRQKDNAIDGLLDIDDNSSSSISTNRPKENIYINNPQRGRYRVKIKWFRNRSRNESMDLFFLVRVNGENIYTSPVTIYEVGSEQTYYEFEY